MFVQGGFAIPGRYLDYAGLEGDYWSSVGSSSSNAYYLYFVSGGVNPSDFANRYNGFSVRCVALGKQGIARRNNICVGFIRYQS